MWFNLWFRWSRFEYWMKSSIRWYVLESARFKVIVYGEGWIGECVCGCEYVCVQAVWKITSWDTIDRNAWLSTSRWLPYSCCKSTLFVHEKRRHYDVQSTSFFHFLRLTSRSTRVLSAPTLYLIAISRESPRNRASYSEILRRRRSTSTNRAREP